MLGFPTPYPQELLYSTVARAGIHDGETSPKQLLDSVFRNRKIIATIDLPSHIKDIAKQYPESLGLGTKELIENHTLWPLYAPFIPYPRRNVIEQLMIAESYGVAHLASGRAASRIKQNFALQLCPKCMEDQIIKYGESFWDRRWQVPLVKSCYKHEGLCETKVRVVGEHRHAYIGVTDAKISKEFRVSESDGRFTVLVNFLLQNPVFESPTYWQWSQFYRQLAEDFGYKLGSRIDHKKILEKYIGKWGESWLRQSKIWPEKCDTSWIRSIFRKHRKSFGFAEHITVIYALSDGRLSVIDALEKALLFPEHEPQRRAIISAAKIASSQDQLRWKSLLCHCSPKAVRKEEPALYARLYRNSYEWLMRINSENHNPSNQINTRINWNARDRSSAKQLMCLIEGLEEDLTLPRLSRSYLVHQLNNPALVEKNLNKLPRCRTLLAYYSESITEYQVRRLTVLVISYLEMGKVLKRWSLLREAGLSNERITQAANDILNGILKNEGK